MDYNLEEMKKRLLQRCFPPIPSDWLQKRLSVEEVESGTPFGKLGEDWNVLKSQMIDHDEIWSFASSPESWERLGGQAGIALVRGGEAIMSIVMVMN